MKVRIVFTPESTQDKSVMILIKSARPELLVIGEQAMNMAMNTFEITTEPNDAERLLMAICKLEKQLGEIKMVASCHKT